MPAGRSVGKGGGSLRIASFPSQAWKLARKRRQEVTQKSAKTLGHGGCQLTASRYDEEEVSPAVSGAEFELAGMNG